MNNKLIIGMVHLKPLLGSPLYSNNNQAILKSALKDAKTLVKAGFNAIMIENMFDTPLNEKLTFEEAIHFASICGIIKNEVGCQVGIDAAFNDFQTALAIAKAIDADFIRIAVYVDTLIFHGGIIKPVAGLATRYRKQIGADHVKIFADVQVKYTELLKDKPIIASAKSAESALADAIIVTGVASGNETPIDLIKKVKSVVKIPVLIGSGIDNENIQKQLFIADGAIIGSSLKKDKDLTKEIDLELASKLINKIKGDK